ncbi:hypothetical protein L7F22_037217 [Adiantum nelumboides]|nr:hypothetical protein [Adiantum nelumboides]
MKQPIVARAALGMALAATLVSAESERATFEPTNIKAPFLEQFTPDWDSRWSPSGATKKQSGGEVFSYVGQWSVEEPTVFPGLKEDLGLVAKSKAAQHAISAPFKEVVDPKKAAKEGKPLVVQYETKLQNGLSCGGAYLKLLTESPEGIQAKEFSDQTPYTIMFGPDKCGATNKVHFIFRHKDPKTGEISEKHLNNAPYAKLSKVSALYTLIVHPDNTFQVLINNDQKRNGTCLTILNLQSIQKRRSKIQRIANLLLGSTQLEFLILTQRSLPIGMKMHLLRFLTLMLKNPKAG